jgi:hypothetical protein
VSITGLVIGIGAISQLSQARALRKMSPYDLK